MPIDIAAKRKSALQFGEGGAGIIDGTIGQGDRKDALGAYRGNLPEFAVIFHYVGDKYKFADAGLKYAIHYSGDKYKFTLVIKG